MAGETDRAGLLAPVLKGLLLACLILACPWSAAEDDRPLSPDALAPSSWTVTVEGESRTRRLDMENAVTGAAGTTLTPGSLRLSARYGWSDGKLQPVSVEVGRRGDTLELTLTTPAKGVIVAARTAPHIFEGVLTTQRGVASHVRLARQDADPPGVRDARLPLGEPAREPVALSRVHMIYMGSSDCPPCVFWMGHDLPRLRGSADFRAIRFSKVEKVIKSPVPPLVFLPDEVKPLKARLDQASSGVHGSAQVAIVIDNEVFDYFLGTRTAEQVEAMLQSIRTGTAYPYQRCLKITAMGRCEQPAR